MIRNILNQRCRHGRHPLQCHHHPSDPTHQWLAGRHARLQWDATITYVLILCNMSYSHAPLIIWCDHSYGPTLFTTWCPGGFASVFMIYLVFSQWEENEANTTTPGQKWIYACFLINFVLAIIRTLHWCLSHFFITKGEWWIACVSLSSLLYLYNEHARHFRDV